MTDLITANSIEDTEFYKNLKGFKKKLILKRDNRALLEQAFIHFNTTGVFLPQLSFDNQKILTEILRKMEPKTQHEINFSELEHKENNPGSQAHFEANKSHFSNQCRIVYEALLTGERLTTTKALLNYGIGDLRRRIKDLKDIWKVPVQDVYVQGKYKEYFINY